MSEEKKKCPACAEEVSAEAIVCEFCGEKLSAASSAQAVQTAQPPELWNPQAAGNWSLLFSPIFGAYVIKNNWKILGCEQKEKRSKNWLIALSAAFIIILLFVDNEYCGTAGIIALLIWYFIECRPQIKYLKENKIDYQKKGWKSLALKAAGILLGVWLFLIIIGMLFGEPALDCSSNQAFMESGKEIAEYLMEDIGVEELKKKAEYGDLTKKDEKQIYRLQKFTLFFAMYTPKKLPRKIVEEIDGMSASDLLDYIDKNYEWSGVPGTVLSPRKH